jgi:hypothetical protein
MLPQSILAGQKCGVLQRFGSRLDRILVPQPNGPHSLRNLVSRKLLQRRRHVLDRGRTVLRTDGPVCVAGDVVRHSLAYIDRSPDRQTNVSLVLYMLHLGQL